MNETTSSEKMLLCVEEVGSLLGVGRTKMYQLIWSGEIDSVTIGRSRKIPRAAVQAYIDSLMETGA